MHHGIPRVYIGWYTGIYPGVYIGWYTGIYTRVSLLYIHPREPYWAMYTTVIHLGRSTGLCTPLLFLLPRVG